MTESPVTSVQTLPLLTYRDDAVLVVVLNRPEHGNALTAQMESAFHAVLEASSADPAVRAVVLTGAGRSFCTGADFSDLGDLAAGKQQYGQGRDFPFSFPLHFKKPLVAAVNGGCAGVGFAYALYADVIFAAADAKFTTAFSRRGLVAEHGTARMLAATVGAKRAADLLLSGRVFTGQDAVGYGLAHAAATRETVLAEALAYAKDLASNCSPWSMARIKEQLGQEPGMTMADAEIHAQELLAQALVRADFQEGVASYQERRTPQFSPLT